MHDNMQAKAARGQQVTCGVPNDQLSRQHEVLAVPLSGIAPVRS